MSLNSNINTEERHESQTSCRIEKVNKGWKGLNVWRDK